MKTKKIISPCIHMNGTGKDTLIDEYERAWNAVENAIDALRRVTVNGRDYYPYDDGPTDFRHFQIAEGDHRNRIIRLLNVKAELAALIVNISKDIREKDLDVEVL